MDGEVESLLPILLGLDWAFDRLERTEKNCIWQLKRMGDIEPNVFHIFREDNGCWLGAVIYHVVKSAVQQYEELYGDT